MTVPINLGAQYAKARDLAASPPASSALAGRPTSDALEARLDRQNLLIQTLLMLLMEKGVIEENEFRRWRDHADHLDGRIDGKLHESAAPTPCPACQRKNAPGTAKCQYCGVELPAQIVDARHKRGVK